jgi:hypothetical protein
MMLKNALTAAGLNFSRSDFSEKFTRADGAYREAG